MQNFIFTKFKMITYLKKQKCESNKVYNSHPMYQAPNCRMRPNENPELKEKTGEKQYTAKSPVTRLIHASKKNRSEWKMPNSRRRSLQQAISEKNSNHCPYTPTYKQSCGRLAYHIHSKLLNKAKWVQIKLKIPPYLLTEVTTSPDASLSGSSAPLAQLAYKIRNKNMKWGERFSIY